MKYRQAVINAAFIVSLFATGLVVAQPEPVVTVSPETIAASNGNLVLDTLWRYHAGDNPQWADPEFDDSDWQIRQSQIHSRERIDDRIGGIVWFRLKLKVDSTLYNRTLAASFSIMGAAEVYLDGKLVFRLGRVATSADEEVALHQELVNPRMLVLGSQPEQIVAVRYSSFSPRLVQQRGRMLGFSMRLGYYTETLDRFVQLLVKGRGLQMFFTGFALAYCLLHLLMFLYYRRLRENLYFAALALGFAGLAYLPTQLMVIPSASTVTLLAPLFKISLLLVSVAGLRVLYSIFYSGLPRLFVVFPAVALALALGVTVIPVDFYYIFCVVAVVEMLRTTVGAVRSKKEYARVIALGYFLFATTSAWSAATSFHVLRSGDDTPHYMFGFMSVMMGMSFCLARSFAKTHKGLEKAEELKKAHRELEEAHAELKDTQAQLIQAEKMASLGQLVAGVAHEINNPIGAISSMHDTLIKAINRLKICIETGCEVDGGHQADLDRFMGVIEDANRVISDGTDRVTNIVRRLRSFARLDEAELKEADINEGLEDTLTLIHHQLKHGISVVREYGKIPPISCFPGQLNQVFLNILVNARQAIEGEGTIRVATYETDGNVCIEIEDSGVGIAPEDLKRIFDPGFTTKGVGVGTGLGLSICYQIIQDHQGEIKVTSEPGKGTTFLIVLPRDRKH